MIVAHEPSPRFAVLPPRGAEASDRTDGIMPPEDGLKPFGEDGLTFADVLDVINPLQHLPVIGTLYRHWTGDTIDPAPRIAGGALFGGPVGAVIGIANVIAERETGRDFGEQAMAWLGDAIFQNDGAPATAAAEPAFSVSGQVGPAASPIQLATAGEPFGWRPPATGFADDVGAASTADDLDVAAFATAGGGKPSLPRAQPLFHDDDEAAFAATRHTLFGAGGEAPPGAVDHAAPSPSAGAAASEGGWFAEAMLTALAKYKQAQALKTVAPAAPISLATNAAGATGR